MAFTVVPVDDIGYAWEVLKPTIPSDMAGYTQFKSLVQCTNPTLWTFLDALKLEQELTDQKITDRLMRVAI